MIGFSALTVRYGGTTALRGITGRVGDGEWLGVIGPNGAGKTTLLSAIARLLPYSGSVTVCDRAADRLSRRELARLIAYVPQRPLLPPDMTVSDYVLLGRTAHIGYLRAETVNDRRVSAAAIDRLDLGQMASRMLRTMSGGELQRVVLARALAQEAPVLLLDEPTSALDLGRRMDALELIDEVRRERSLTVLSAIHDLTLAGQFADRLLLLAAGQIGACGPASEVLRGDVLAEHFGPGVQVLTTDGGDIAVISRRTPRRLLASVGAVGATRASANGTSGNGASPIEASASGASGNGASPNEASANGPSGNAPGPNEASAEGTYPTNQDLVKR
jgi:iron complex transport system ATP-binding protein